MTKTVMSLLSIFILTVAAASVAISADQQAGQKIFFAKCATCHSKDGKGRAAMAKMFHTQQTAMDLTSETAQKQSDADLTKIILGGQKSMPPFKGALKDAEIADVLGYVRTFGAKYAAAGLPVKKDAKTDTKSDTKPAVSEPKKP